LFICVTFLVDFTRKNWLMKKIMPFKMNGVLQC